jgi:hypothetical protein
MLIVQIVEIGWTKATRGAPMSRERAVLPRAFPIEVDASTCAVLHHKMLEWEAFIPQVVRAERLQSIPGAIDVLRIQPERHGVVVLGMLATPNAGSQPKRRAISEAMRLLPGQWGRLVINSRYTSYRGQRYYETIFNVAVGPDVPADRFMQGSPDHDLDLKADLF